MHDIVGLGQFIFLQYCNGILNLSSNYPKEKQTVNLGSLPYVSNADEEGQRTIVLSLKITLLSVSLECYHWFEFRMLEINLFLEHRYKGLFMRRNRGGKRTLLVAVSYYCAAGLANL